MMTLPSIETPNLLWVAFFFVISVTDVTGQHQDSTSYSSYYAHITVLEADRKTRDVIDLGDYVTFTDTLGNKISGPVSAISEDGLSIGEQFLLYSVIARVHSNKGRQAGKGLQYAGLGTMGLGVGSTAFILSRQDNTKNNLLAFAVGVPLVLSGAVMALVGTIKHKTPRRTKMGVKGRVLSMSDGPSLEKVKQLERIKKKQQ